MLDQRLRINDLAVAAGGENAAKLLNLTVPTALQDARSPRNLELPGWRLHQLKGDRRGQWSGRVSGNWRIVFRFADGEAVDVDLIDYH